MSKATDDISAQASALSPTEKLELVDRIVASLDETDPALDNQWLREAEQRLTAYRRGEIQAISLTDVLAHYGRS